MAQDAVDLLLAGFPDDTDTQAVGLIGRVFRLQAHLERRLAVMLEPFGLDRGQSDVLGTLMRAGREKPLTPGALSGSLMCSSGAMTNRLDRLERAGLIARGPDPEDRRGVRIMLTHKGEQTAKEIAKARKAIAESFFPGLSAKERRELTDLLRRTLVKLESEPNQPDFR